LQQLLVFNNSVLVKVLKHSGPIKRQDLQAAQGNVKQATTGLGQLAQTFGGLGTQQLAGELDITKTMGAYGDLDRAIAQQKLDAQRGAYLMQQAEYGT
jgi:hypothetical protein